MGTYVEDSIGTGESIFEEESRLIDRAFEF